MLSSVAVAGKSNNGVVFCADFGGSFHALSLTSGAALYNYKTGGYIVSSPAVSDNDVLIASTDGLLYDFSLGGSNERRFQRRPSHHLPSDPLSPTRWKHRHQRHG